MVTKELITYLENSLKGGYGEEDLRKALITAGWNPQDVAEGFATLKGGAPLTSPTQPPAQTAPKIQTAPSINPPILTRLAPTQPLIMAKTATAKPRRGWMMRVMIIVLLLILGGGGYVAYQRYFKVPPPSVAVVTPPPQLPPPIPERIQLASAKLDTLPETFTLATSSARNTQFVFSPDGSKVAYK